MIATLEPVVANAAARTMAMQSTPQDVIQTAVDLVQRTLGSDVSFAAVAAPEPGVHRMAASSGIRDPRWKDIVIRPRLGLGGQVVAHGRPFSVTDYPADPHISRDFVEIVAGGEGLRAMACVPVAGGDGIEVLLYAASRTAGVLADRSVEALAEIGTLATMGLDQARALERTISLERLRERERVASELHDSVAQRLFAIGALVRSSQVRPDHHDDGLLGVLDSVDSLAAEARRELRDIMSTLTEFPPELTFDLRLESAMRQFESATGCAVRVVSRGPARPLAGPAAQILVDTAVEGARNAVKHARARLVLVTVSHEDDWLSLDVEQIIASGSEPRTDDEPTSTGLGLRSLRRRAERLGGTLELSPTGMVLRLQIPSYDL